MTKLLSLRLPLGNELAERHEAAVQPARPIVQCERVDAAQLASRRPEDQDIVIVERFGTAFGPVDPQGATDLVDDRGLVDDLRTARGRKRDTILRLAGQAAFQQQAKPGFGLLLFARGGAGRGRYGGGRYKRRAAGRR